MKNGFKIAVAALLTVLVLSVVANAQPRQRGGKGKGPGMRPGMRRGMGHDMQRGHERPMASRGRPGQQRRRGPGMEKKCQMPKSMPMPCQCKAKGPGMMGKRPGMMGKAPV